MLGGVAGGLGRHFNIDPVVFRIALAALAFVGGVGVFVYVAALLFVPVEGEERTLLTGSRVLTVLGAVILGFVSLAIIADVTDDAGFLGLVPLALLAGGAYAVVRALRNRPGDGPVTARRVAAWVAVGAGGLLLAVVLFVGAAYVAAEGSGALVAGIVILIGFVLVGSALRGGGARWLALPALVVAVPLGIVSAADIRLDGGYGERDFRPATIAELPTDGYELAAGELRLDLRDVEFPRGRETVIPISLGLGYAEVVLPPGVCATTDSRFGGGFMSLRGREAGGVDVDFLVRGEAADAPRVLVRGDVGFGAIEVVDEPDFERRSSFGPGADEGMDDGFDEDFGDQPVRDGACSRVEIASAE